MRLSYLDIARFLACLSVVFYHYFFLAPVLGYSKIYVEEFKYGFLGVQFFFMISGYVITLSVSNKTFQKFILLRAIRLYPAYWISMFFSLAICVYLSFIELNLIQFFLNLTMFQGFIGVQHIDGVYWTLTVELVFYFWMAFLIATKSIKNILNIFIVWNMIAFLDIFLSINSKIRVVFLFDYISYFTIGLCFYYFHKSQSLDYKLGLLFLISIFMGGYRTFEKSSVVFSGLNTNYNVFIVLAIYSSFIIYFKFKDRVNLIVSSKTILIKVVTYLGMITYPLYLLHQNIGYAIFNKYTDEINNTLLMMYTIFFVMVLSVVLLKIEVRLSFFIKQKLMGP